MVVTLSAPDSHVHKRARYCFDGSPRQILILVLESHSAARQESMDLRLQAKFRIAVRAGMDLSAISPEDANRNVPVNTAIMHAFGSLDPESQQRALPILADGIAATSTEHLEDMKKLVHQHGYEYINSSFVPVGLIDEREAPFLPLDALTDLTKAIARLANSDESGAITAACAAIDATTTALYQKHHLGDPSASFQAKVNTVLNHLHIFEKLKADLFEIGVSSNDAEKIADEMHKATKHAVVALQTIRRTNGDVHGTKPTYRRVVYDTIKWSSAVCGLLEGE